MDPLAVDLLKPDDEHGAVRFGEDRRTDLDDVVGSNGEEEAIERGVMELAQGDAVADDRVALGVALGRDVGCVQELQVAQPAERTALGVRQREAVIPSWRAEVSAAAGSARAADPCPSDQARPR